MAKSNTDIAYAFIEEHREGVHFQRLWDVVSEEKEYTLERKNDLISDFYTDLMLDGRFITLGENVWALREDYAFDKVHIDMNDIYSSDDDEIIEVEEGIIVKEDLEVDKDESESAQAIQEEE